MKRVRKKRTDKYGSIGGLCMPSFSISQSQTSFSGNSQSLTSFSGNSQSLTSFSGNSQSLTSFSGNSSPASHPFWRKEQTFLFYPIVACVGFSCRTLQRMHVRGLVHSYTFLFDPSIASDWRTSIAPFWTDMCCRLKYGRRPTDVRTYGRTDGAQIISAQPLRVGG